MKEQKEFLIHILEAIEAIQSFVGDMEFSEFAKDDKTVSAVIRKFEIIGEAAKQLDQSITEKKPNIPWKRMMGMRDRLIHDYFGVDVQLLWRTYQNELPVLKDDIQSLLDEL